MKKIIYLFTLVLFLLSGFAGAQQLTSTKNSDLSLRLQAELSDYKGKIQSQSGTSLIATADLIVGSGLDDPQLYSTVETKLNSLLSEHRANPKDKEIAVELNAVMRALGSMDPKSESLIQEILATSKSRGVRERAVRLIPKLYWFSQRNKIMQKPDFYMPGQNLMTYRFLNLIANEDPRNGRWAVDEIVRRNGAEQIVYRKMAEVLQQQYQNIKSDIQLDTLAAYCKVLSKYDANNSSELLRSIKQDPKAHKKLIKYISV